MLIGLDLDNTIIDYDRAFVRAGVTMQLLPEDFAGTKRDIRAYLRAMPDGELLWQRLQAQVYGPDIRAAIPSMGIQDFIRRCRERGFDLVIVSHKTQFASVDPGGNDLRASAVGWLEENGLSQDEGGTALPVYFADTRSEKLARIAALGCRYFVDDLEEVLLDAGFPAETTGVLFAPDCSVQPEAAKDLPVCRTWVEVATYIFNDVRKYMS